MGTEGKDGPLDDLRGAPRLLMQVELSPAQGDRFQPTGFADLGAAVYERPDGKRMLLVESAQSMANRLERAILDGDGPLIAKEFEGLPYVEAVLTGDIDARTSSLVEAHRLNSPFIISDEGFKERFASAANYGEGRPMNWKAVGGALFHYDPNSLIHGVFMANLGDGRMRVPRALSAFIEAEDVMEAASGGVKNNPLDPTGTIRAVGYDKDVYGNVPYHRMEYTAGKITAFFNLDLSMIDGYGMEPEASELLIALSLYKMRWFLDGGLRLRTACDLVVKGPSEVEMPNDFVLPERAVLLGIVQRDIRACTEKGLFAKPPVTSVTTKVVRKKKAKEEAEEGASEVEE